MQNNSLPQITEEKLEVLEPIKPPADQISVMFNIGDNPPMGKSYPLCGDTSGLTYDYWG